MSDRVTVVLNLSRLRVTVAVCAAVASLIVVALPAAAATSADLPVLTITGHADCGVTAGYLGASWTVTQNTDLVGTFVSVTGSPNTVQPGYQLVGQTPTVLSQLMPGALAASSNFVASVSVTIRFDLPAGPVTVSGSGTMQLPLCPGPIAQGSLTRSAISCDGTSFDLVYNPGYLAASTVVTFYGRGYYQQLGWRTQTFTVAPGTGIHVFIPFPYDYVVQASQDNYGFLPWEYIAVDRPAGCPPYPAPSAESPTPGGVTQPSPTQGQPSSPTGGGSGGNVPANAGGQVPSAVGIEGSSEPGPTPTTTSIETTEIVGTDAGSSSPPLAADGPPLGRGINLLWIVVVAILGAGAALTFVIVGTRRRASP